MRISGIGTGDVVALGWRNGGTRFCSLAFAEPADHPGGIQVIGGPFLGVKGVNDSSEAEVLSGAEIGPEGDRHFVTALARGLELLRCFRAGELGLTNTDFAERSGLPKPTVSRLTYTLTKLGYLTYSQRSGRYQLGNGVLALGYGLLSGLDMRTRARPLMQALASDVDASVALGARDRLAMVYLDCVRGAGTVTLRLDVGSRIPLATTAMGRALLAALPEGERDYLMRAIKERAPDDFARIEAGVAQACADLADKGFTASFGDWQPDVHAVAVPVFQADGERLFAINCGCPAFMVSAKRLSEEVGPRLAKTARTLSTAAP